MQDSEVIQDADINGLSTTEAEFNSLSEGLRTIISLMTPMEETQDIGINSLITKW